MSRDLANREKPRGDPWGAVVALQEIGVVAFYWVLALIGPQIVSSEWRLRGWSGLLPVLIILSAAMCFVTIDGVRAWRAGARRPLLLRVIAPTALLLVSLAVWWYRHVADAG